MKGIRGPWDHLIVSASNDAQAAGYEAQLTVRRELGELSQARVVCVVADPGGRRIGSGASTVLCLRRVIEDEGTLESKRILIVHAGGDSKRLPAYGPCGKIFVPVPGKCESALPVTLFDRLAATLMALPAPEDGGGQVVVASGDALALFDPDEFELAARGVTALGHFTTPDEASRHGVFCIDGAGALRRYLQKPSLEELRQQGALDQEGRAVLDLGLMSFDTASAALLLDIQEGEFDLYREVFCAIGAEADLAHYRNAACASGSKWSDEQFAATFARLHAIPVTVRVPSRCSFLHFGATGQLVASGLELLRYDGEERPPSDCLCVSSELGPHAQIAGARAWIEGCRIAAPLTLGGDNVIVGVDIEEPLRLPERACLDVLAGTNGQWFVRCYGTGDAFKDAQFCGRPVLEWLAAVGATAQEVWREGEDTLWDARVFPAVGDPREYRDWLWMFDPDGATEAQKRAWLDSLRYSAAEMAGLSSQEQFHSRRVALRATERV